jgi:hypothetical protein
MNQISNELYNLEDTSTNSLPIDIGNPNFTGIATFKFKVDMIILDLEVTPDYLFVLYKFKDIFKISKINRKSLKLESDGRVIKLFDKFDLLGSPKICNNNEIWYFKKGSNYLYRETFK